MIADQHHPAAPATRRPALRRAVAHVLCCASVLGWLSACSPFTPATRPSLSTALPASYSLYTQTDAAASDWWRDFGWPQLDQVIDKALTQNLSLREVWARLQQSQALARISQAQRRPELTGSAEAAHRRSGQQLEDRRSISSVENFALALAGSYELDLWGRVAAAVHSNTLVAEASAEDWQTARVTMAAQVAQTWIALVAQQQLLPLARQQWQRAQRQLALLEQRYRQGMATGVEMTEQQRRVAEYRAALLPLEEREQQLCFELALLVGELPSWRAPLGTQPLPEPQALNGLGVPADLLAQRPDVRAAGLRLQAADWSVAAARADRLPALRLTASAATDSEKVAELFDNWLANLAASVSGPVFDGGRRRSEVARNEAVVAERLAAYQRVVLTAMSEVETALMQEHKRAMELQAVSEQLHRQQQLCRQLEQRYRQGDGSYLTLLGAEQTRTLLTQQRVQVQRDWLLARSALHRALGGRVSESAQEHNSIFENIEG